MQAAVGLARAGGLSRSDGRRQESFEHGTKFFGTRFETVCSANDLIDRRGAHLGEQLAHLSGERPEVALYHLGTSGEACA